MTEIIVFNNDWIGHLKEEYQVNIRLSYIKKIIYNFDFSGKLKKKKILQAKLKSKPHFSKESTKIFNQSYPSEFYKFKKHIKYVYNGLDLISEEVELFSSGYEKRKTYFEYGDD